MKGDIRKTYFGCCVASWTKLFALVMKHFKLGIRMTLIWLCWFVLLQPAIGQQSYPKDYFRPPVDFRLLLSGTFGELRSNHFHSGMDIKTNGTTGAKVYAIADGYVSRINVSAYGFGKALYITHPNGFTSVYGHLDYFSGEIHRYVIREHYSRESFELVLYPTPGEFPVKKGDIIAYSGNSGSSGGPHLHFEIRDEASQEPINPLLFGYDVKDYYRPKLTWLKIYAVDENSRINGAGRDVKYQVEGWGEEHRLSTTKLITLSGKIAFGIQCYDQQNDTQNKNGVYSVKVYFDGKPVNSTRMETFSFTETRYVNSLIDYGEYMRSSMRFQRTEIDPNNKLNIYEGTVNDGIIFIDDTLDHTVRYEVTDIPGNLSVLEFTVKGEKTVIREEISRENQSSDSTFFFYDRINIFKTSDFIIETQPGSLYRSFRFYYEKSPPVKDCYSDVHHIHDKYTPVHDPVTVAIKPQGLPEHLKAKALIVKLNEESPKFSYAGGTYEPDGFVRSGIREFGNYSVTVDTIPPMITALNSSFHKNLTRQRNLKFTIRDELSGIKSYRATLNGEWILMDYDAKNNLLVYYIDDHLKQGSNAFHLEVLDMKDNRRIYETTLVR